MIYAAAGVTLLYYFLFILYYRHLVPAEGKKPIYIILSTISITGAYLYVNVIGKLWLTIIVIGIVMIISCRFLTGMNWMQAFHSGSLCVLSRYCFRGIFTAFSFFIFNGYDFSYDASSYYTITLFATPFTLLFFVFLRKTIFTDHKLSYFLHHNNQLKIVIMYEIVASANLIFINLGRYLSPNAMWYMEITLGACVLTISMLVYTIYQAIKSSEYLEFQWKMEALEEQYKRQLRHYESYQKYTESFRVFKHDYIIMMTSLKALLRKNETKKAMELLDDIYNEMQTKVTVHKKYSDNIVLDAMLQELAALCIEHNIRFSFKVFVPRDTKLSLLDAVRLFYNITNNAVEACKKIPTSERFIDITGGNEGSWATLVVVNSYDGRINVKDGKLFTTKLQKQSHGLGMKSIKDIVEKLGGFMICNGNSEEKTFLLRVHIPRVGIKHQ